VPLIGSQLTKTAAGQFITALQTALKNAFANLDTSQGYGLQGALFEALGPDGLNVLQPADGSTRAPTIADVGGTQDSSGNINYEVHLHLAAGSNTGRVNFDAGTPGLIKFNDTAHSVVVQVGFDMDLKFGTTTGSTPTPFIAKSTLSVPVSASAAGMDIPGTLFFMKVDAKDTGSSFGGTYNLTFSRPGAAALALIGSPTLTGSGVESLHLDASWIPIPGGVNWGPTNTIPGAIGAALNNLYPPHILADFNLTWKFNNASTLAPPAKFGSNPVVQFNNVALDLGSFFGSWAAPLVNIVRVVTGPLEGLAEFLLQPVPVLNDITTFFKAGTFDIATLIGLDAQVVTTGNVPGTDSTSAIDMLHYVANAIEIINHLNIAQATGTIALGSFSFNLRDPAPTTAPLDGLDLIDVINWSPNVNASAQAQNNSDPKIGGIFKVLHKIQFNFPILDDPSNVFRMLMGNTSISLFDFKVNLGLSATIYKKLIMIPVPLLPPGSVNFFFNWNLNLPALNFEIGFDEAGVKTGHLVDGFFIKNLVIGVSTTISMGAEIGVPDVVEVKMGVAVSFLLGAAFVDTSLTAPNNTMLRGNSLAHLGMIPTASLTGSPFAELDLFSHCLLKISFGKLVFDATGVHTTGITTGC
jgi:hypothetical protein